MNSIFMPHDSLLSRLYYLSKIDLNTEIILKSRVEKLLCGQKWTCAKKWQNSTNYNHSSSHHNALWEKSVVKVARSLKYLEKFEPNKSTYVTFEKKGGQLKIELLMCSSNIDNNSCCMLFKLWQETCSPKNVVVRIKTHRYLFLFFT